MSNISTPAAAPMRRGPSATWWILMAAVMALGLSGCPGCTSPSVQIALEAQQRADEVQATVFDNQHEALRILLYRDLRQRLAVVEDPNSAAAEQALSRAWNERDLLEFWRVQYERARALRLSGVDMQLYGQQGVAELLYKRLLGAADQVKVRAAEMMAAEILPVKSREAKPRVGDQGPAQDAEQPPDQAALREAPGDGEAVQESGDEPLEQDAAEAGPRAAEDEP